MTDMIRGRIYRARLTHIGEDKFFLVVSNNRRNRAFGQVLAARLTTTPPRDERPAMVPLGPGEVMTGWVSCDDIEVLYDDEIQADAGAITPPAMRRVDAGLRAALGLPDLFCRTGRSHSPGDLSASGTITALRAGIILAPCPT